ncbi:MAG: hypothetical protein A2W28_11370 [Gammaproteobacteria bacterium RBG_16_51_14]|nr:MAG: hypothetical protein A2W28_11370 [Gammaproteobacteria bacterium RBG_16_51_14]
MLNIEAVQRVAAELDASCIDLPVSMLWRGIHPVNFLAEVHIHLTTEGNRDYAEMIFTALKEMELFSRVPVNKTGDEDDHLV